MMMLNPFDLPVSRFGHSAAADPIGRSTESGLRYLAHPPGSAKEPLAIGLADTAFPITQHPLMHPPAFFVSACGSFEKLHSNGIRFVKTMRRNRACV
jgi:hypothetical protein